MRHNLTELESFDAMRAFLEAYWRRGLCASDDLAVLLGSINRTPWPSDKQMPHLVGAPLDIAQWDDWLNAIEASQKDKPSPA
jgi:hypothetical protein